MRTLSVSRIEKPLFDPADMGKKGQAGYTVEPSSALERKPAATAQAMDFVAPLSPAEQKTSPKFFQILRFVLEPAPVLPDEKELPEQFAAIVIGPTVTSTPTR